MLGRIESRLDRLETRLEAVAGQANSLVAVAGDTVDRFAAVHDLHERVEAAVKVLERLSRPQTMAQLDKLIETTEMLPTMLVSAADAFDHLALQAEEKGVDLGTVLPKLVDVLTVSARAIQTAPSAEQFPAGFFGLLRVLKDPEIRKTMGIAMHVAKSVGATVSEDHGPSALPAAQ
jgi:uncharacterized protein YjgD (DUF1641 family)